MVMIHGYECPNKCGILLYLHESKESRDKHLKECPLWWVRRVQPGMDFTIAGLQEPYEWEVYEGI